MHPYEPRPIRFHRLHDVDGWRLKLYSIAYGSAPIDWSAFEPALWLVDAELPRPPVTPARAGVGFVIAHQGRTALYCVLAWWDNENELPVRVFVRPIESNATWRPAQGPESVCVWDLQVIAFERDAYVATVLSNDHDAAVAPDEYLSAVLEQDPTTPHPAPTLAAPR
jgi:hypothetical protein